MGLLKRLALALRPHVAAAPILEVTDDGVARRIAGGREERVRWADLEAVDILTTSDGPFAEDVFFVLRGARGTGCVVPQGDAMGTDLLARLQALPDFDHVAVIRAMGSCDDASFPCWRRDPSRD